MTKEQTVEAIKVMQAYVDGKEIYCDYGKTGHHEVLISTLSDASWNWAAYNYRLAHEKKKVPLTKEDWKGQPVVWVRSPNSNEHLVTTIRDDRVFFASDSSADWSDLFTRFSYSFDRITWHECFKYEESK